MKTLPTEFRVIVIFLSILMFLPFSSCDSDDNEVFEETFLEAYDGTKWVSSEEGITVYLRINNDLQKPIDIWVSEVDFAKGDQDPKCYYHNYFYDYEWLGEKGQIVENTKNRFVISYMEQYTLTFTVQGDTMQLRARSANGEEEVISLEKTTVDVDAFDLCPID